MADCILISFDYAVKYPLRGQEDYVILSGFLTELMGRKIDAIGLLPDEINKSGPNEKTNRIDLKAQVGGREIVVFEIQFHLFRYRIRHPAGFSRKSRTFSDKNGASMSGYSVKYIIPKIYAESVYCG